MSDSKPPKSSGNRPRGVLIVLALAVGVFYLTRGEHSAPDKSSELASLKHEYAVDIDRDDKAGALKTLDRGIELEPKNPLLWRLRAALKERMGLVPQAYDDLKQALVLRPDDVDSLTALAALQYKDKSYDQAIETYQKLCEIKDKRAQVVGINGKALVKSSLGQLDIARKLANDAIKLDPFCVKSREILGNILQKQGDLRAAIDSYTEGLRIDRESVDLYNNRALAYKKLGMVSECSADLEALIRLKPDEPIYKERLKELKETAKK